MHARTCIPGIESEHSSGGCRVEGILNDPIHLHHYSAFVPAEATAGLLFPFDLIKATRESLE